MQTNTLMPALKFLHNDVAKILDLLGEPTLLLGWPLGTKGNRKKWGHLTASEMIVPKYLETLSSGNIGVALGEKSGGLCSIDIDADELVAPFLVSNPALQETLRSRGIRGCNIWIRFMGAYPNRTSKLLTTTKSQFGEFRSTGSQTIIYGKHPSGCDYTNNDKPVLSVKFGDLVWHPLIANPPRLHEGSSLHCTEETEETEATEQLTSCACGAFFTTVHSIEDALRLSMPTNIHQSNDSLFTLARAIKALELNNESYTPARRREIFGKWYHQAQERGFLRPEQTEEQYLLEFLNAYTRAKYPIGGKALPAAWARAKESKMVPEALRFMNAELRMLVMLCRELQIQSGNEPFYLSARAAANVLGHDTHSTAAHWLCALVGDGILSVARNGNRVKATRYRYIADLYPHASQLNQYISKDD